MADQSHTLRKGLEQCGRLIALLSICLLAAGCPLVQEARPVRIVKPDKLKAVELGPIRVVGDERFCAAITEALQQLETSAPEALEIVKDYSPLIKQNDRSGMAADALPPTMNLADVTVYYSPTWCAGVIAHESIHARLYRDYEQAHGTPVPFDAWGSQQCELTCIEHQLKVLRLLGAPQHELDHLHGADGLHNDINGDGKFDWDDYELRTW